MRPYHGLKAEKIEFGEYSSIIATSMGSCYYDLLYSGAINMGNYYARCQEAINEGPEPSGFTYGDAY